MADAKPPESRLGRGLGSLLGEYLEESETETASERQVLLRRIRPNPYQPRAEFDEAGIAELAASIRENGLLQPLIVRPRGDEGWELVAGERRFRAVERLGWERVPVLVRELTDQQLLVLALVENLQREDLSPLEEAEGYRRLVDQFGLTQQEVGDRVGRDRSTVANALRLLSLAPGVRELLAAGRLTAGHGRALLGLEEPEEQERLARAVVDSGLSVRETERRVRRRRDAGRDTTPSAAPEDPTVRRAVTLLERSLGTQVRVQPRGPEGRGEITIRFHDPEDFERLVRRLAGDAASELFD